MRNGIAAYAKERGLIKRGNKYYQVVARSRPTKFLGWALFDTSLMNETGVRISRFFKSKDEVLAFTGGALRRTWAIRRCFKSKGKQHLQVWAIPKWAKWSD
jgi:hypothetical protein